MLFYNFTLNQTNLNLYATDEITLLVVGGIIF